MSQVEEVKLVRKEKEEEQLAYTKTSIMKVVDRTKCKSEVLGIWD